MSFTSTTNRMSYTGNASTATYAYTFKIFDQDDLLVTVRNPTTDEETTLTIATDYTVTGVGTASGGNVVLVDAGQAWIDGSSFLDTGWVLAIRRVRPLTQETDIRNQGAFYAETHEDTFDHIMMVSQQQQDELDRSIKLPETIDPATFDTKMPAGIVGANNLAIVVNATGDGFALGPTSTEISEAQTNAVLAEEWASKTDGIVDATDYSAKAWSVGGTGVTTTATRGSAKDWATKTDAAVDTAEFSAKEYAQGTQAATGGSAKSWAQDTGADVTGAAANSRSAKSWAQDANTGATLGGSAKDWAQNTSVPVDGVSGYSAKEHAQGTQTRGAAGGGSAKDWATYMGGTVDDTDYSAKYHADAAAASAQAAANVVAAAIWNDVSFKSFADTPIAIVDGNTGTLFEIDCTAGNVVVNLPEISTLTLTNPWTVGIRKSDSSANTITINPFAGEHINQAASAITLDTQNQGVTLVPDVDTTPDNWSAMQYGDLKNLRSPTITTPTINGGTIDLGTASNTNKLVLPAETTANLDALTDDAGFVAYDTTKGKPVYNDGANWKVLGSGSGVGGISYFEGIDLATDTTNISTYDDTGAYVDGTGGSPSVITIARNTTTPLDADGDLQISKSAADGTGEGVTLLSDTIDIADRGRKLWNRFEWDGTDANYVSEDMVMYAYDVTNSEILTVIPVAGFVQDSNGLATLPAMKTQVLGYVIPKETCTSIRVSLHLLSDSATAAAWDCFVARPRLSPEASVPGAIVTEWQSYTPTGSWVTNAAYTGRWRRVGDSMQVEALVTCSGTPTAATLSINLPSGYTIDTTKITQTSNSVLGTANIEDALSNNYAGIVWYGSTSSVQVVIQNATSTYASNQLVTNTVPVSFGASDNVKVHFSVPISGWSASAALSTTEVGLQTVQVAATTTGNSYGNSATTTITYSSETKDNYNAFVPGTGTFTAPKSGRYSITASTEMTSASLVAGAAFALQALVNGSTAVQMDKDIVQVNHTGETNLSGTVSLDLNYGDTVVVQVVNGSTANRTASATANENRIQITEVPDFTTFATFKDNADVELYMDSPTGHGSTNTKIRNGYTVRKSTGSGVYYDYVASSATLGASVTIKVPGLYSVRTVDGNTASVTIVGISVNCSTLTTTIDSVTYAGGKRACIFVSASNSNTGGEATATLRLSAGDVIRPHQGGVSLPNYTGDSALFQLIRIGE